MTLQLISKSSINSLQHRILLCRKQNIRIFPQTIIHRYYRGDSGEMKHRSQVQKQHDDEITKREERLLSIALPKADIIMEKHLKMPKLDNIPNASLPFDILEKKNNSASSSLTNTTKEELELQVRKKRLVYRSKQRGWLEVDLLLGTWASQHVEGLTMDELNQFEDFVNLETIDIYNIITLRAEVPDFMCREGGNGVVERIQEWARTSPLGKGDPDMYGDVKKQHNLI